MFHLRFSRQPAQSLHKEELRLQGRSKATETKRECSSAEEEASLEREEAKKDEIPLLMSVEDTEKKNEGRILNWCSRRGCECCAWN